MNKDIPLKGTITSERPSSESEDECKLGIEDIEGIGGVAPVSESGVETGGLTGESRDDEGAAAQMLREDRTTVG